MEACMVSMLYTAVLLVVALFKTPVIAEERRERFWNGKPQAIGIDLSPSFIHAVRYNPITKEFTNLASIPSSDQYGLFMYETFQREQLNHHNHFKDFTAYERWRPIRNIVQSSWLTDWIGNWVPQMRKEYRYTTNINLDIPINSSWKAYTWLYQLKSTLERKILPYERATEFHSLLPGRLPLDTTNFVNVVASALESLKVEVWKTHDINITSAVIATPHWIGNDLDRLIERACYKANVEMLDKEDRAEAARLVPRKAEKTDFLVLEQCGYYFRLSKWGGSMGRDDISGSWVPGRLTSDMLESLGFLANGTIESLNVATRRLAMEILKARMILKKAYLEEPELLNDEETMIVIPNFGSDDFTFAQALSGASIMRVEEAYTQAVQRAIEIMLLKDQDIHKYRKENGLDDDFGGDREALEIAMVDIAKTVPHPQAASGVSWWNSVHALLVVADFPDNSLIQRAAKRAIGSIPDMNCSQIFNPDYVHHDLVARGAAIEASKFVESWENQERESLYSEYDGSYSCEEEYEEEVESE